MLTTCELIWLKMSCLPRRDRVWKYNERLNASSNICIRFSAVFPRALFKLHPSDSARIPCYVHRLYPFVPVPVPLNQMTFTNVCGIPVCSKGCLCTHCQRHCRVGIWIDPFSIRQGRKPDPEAYQVITWPPAQLPLEKAERCLFVSLLNV